MSENNNHRRNRKIRIEQTRSYFRFTRNANSDSNIQPHLPARSAHAVTVTDSHPDTFPATFFKALYLPHFSTDSHPNHRSTNSHSFHTAYSTTHCCAHYPDCFSHNRPDVFAWKPHSSSIPHTVPGAVCPAVCEADSSPQRSSHCSTDIHPNDNSTHTYGPDVRSFRDSND